MFTMNRTNFHERECDCFRAISLLLFVCVIQGYRQVALFNAYHSPKQEERSFERFRINSAGFKNYDDSLVLSQNESKAKHALHDVIWWNKMPFESEDVPLDTNLTIFTTANRFQYPEVAALRSWIDTGADVVVFVDDQESIETLSDWARAQLAKAKKKPWFLPTPKPILLLPLLNATFAEAVRISRTDWLCFVNADIVFPKTFAAVTQYGANRLREHNQSLVFSGARWDCYIDEEFLMENEGELDLFSIWQAEKTCYFHGLGGKDYFVFRKGSINVSQLPPFRLGADIWDSWFLNAHYNQTVDVTPTFLTIHMEHRIRSSTKREAANLENALLASCTAHQKELYAQGVKYSARQYGIWQCVRQQQMDRVQWQLCPFANQQPKIVPLHRPDYAEVWRFVLYGLNFTIPDAITSNSEQSKSYRHSTLLLLSSMKTDSSTINQPTKDLGFTSSGQTCFATLRIAWPESRSYLDFLTNATTARRQGLDGTRINTLTSTTYDFKLIVSPPLTTSQIP